MTVVPDRVWRRRSSRARGGLAAIAATVGAVTLGLTLTVGVLERSSSAALNAALAHPSDTSMTIAATVAGNGTAQDTAIRRSIATSFGDAPVVVARATHADPSTGDLTGTWTITPDPARATTAQVTAYDQGFRTVAEVIERTPAAQAPAVTTGGTGPTTMSTIRRAVGAVDAIAPVPVALLAVSGLIAMLLVCGLLVESRRNETRFLRSRGGSVGSIVRLDAREAVLTSAAGTLVGAGLGVAAIRIVAGSFAASAGWVVAVAAALVCSLLVHLAVSTRAAATASGLPQAGTGRVRAITSWSLLAAGVVLAAVATWRLKQSAGDGAAVGQDLLAVLAPGLLVGVLAVLGLLLAISVGRLVEHRSRRRRGTAVLPVWQVLRSTGMLAGPAVLLVLAVALTVVAGAYAGTWQRFAEDSQRWTTGGDLRVTTRGAELIDDAGQFADPTRYRAQAGDAAVAPVSAETDQLGDIPVTVVGVDASLLPSLVGRATTVGDPRSIEAALSRSARPGILLPRTAATVTLALIATAVPTADAAGPGGGATTGTLSTTLWLQDAVGDLVPVTLGDVPVATASATSPSGAGAATTSTTLPPHGPWRIVAIDAHVAASGPRTRLRVSITGLATSGASPTRIALPAAAWTPVDRVFADGVSGTVPGDALSFTRAQVTSDGLDVRLMPSGIRPVPVVLSADLAASEGFHVGSRFELDGQWASFDAVVAGVTDLVPGTTSGASMVADLPTLDLGRLSMSQQLPAIHQLWLSATDAATTAPRLADAFPADSITTADHDSGTDFTGIAAEVLWIGGGAAGVFALITFAAAALAVARRRRPEAAVLSALGVPATRMRRWRRQELAIVALTAVVVGVATGAVTSLLTAPTLARLATPTAPPALPIGIGVDPGPVAAVLLVVAALVATLIVAAGRGIRQVSPDRGAP